MEFLKLRKQGKAAHNQETFPRKMTKFRLWKNVEGNTVRDYFKDTATPHFFNVAIRCIVLIKTAFSQARHPLSLFLCDKMA